MGGLIDGVEKISRDGGIKQNVSSVVLPIVKSLVLFLVTLAYD